MTTLTIDPMLMADLSATCNNLGYLDEATGKYKKEPECLECVKDLIRYLRRDDENHEIRRALGETKVVVKDLIPIIKHHSSDPELMDITLRLLVNLTTPALILYEEELPAERVSRRYYLEVIQYLQNYKEAFSDKPFWSVLVEKLTELLAKDWERRMEDDRLMIERILILARNVLSVPANPAAEKRTDDDASVHDQVLWAMHLAGLDDMILFIAQSDNEQHLCIHVLEVVSLMLREQDAKVLARSGAARSEQERQKDIQELELIRKQEHQARELQKRKLSNLRHTRFGGTYRVQNLSSISDKDLIYHRPLAQMSQLSFDKDKVPRKTPKNRQPLMDGETTRRSMLTIRLFLKQFCAELLAGAYNKIMYNVKDDLARSKAQAHDESYYMWSMKFFMEFNRHHQFRVDRVSETLSVAMFHYIQTQIESHMEMMTMEKRKLRVWSKRAHLALRAYQELLFTIQHMDACRDESTREASRVLKSNLFYMPEYRELIYVLLCQYSPVKMSRRFLTDLVETAHVFIKLLEKFSGGGRIIVKRKKMAKRKSQSNRAAARRAAPAPEADREETWQGLSEELSAALQGERELPTDVLPFDAASEVPIDQQKAEAMRRIQGLLRAGEGISALALFRAAREVWPEGDAFGGADIQPQDEFLALREIHLTQLPGAVEADRPTQTESTAADELSPAPAEPAMEELLREEEGDNEEDEEETEVAQERESEFDFQDFIKRFTNTKVLEPYCALLRHFETNSAEANYCVVKMLHRVAWDHKLPALLFQASLFRTFQQIMEDPRHYHNPPLKEVVRLGKHVLRAFFTIAKTNKKVFVELLFWKTVREAYELEHGYDTFQTASKAAKLAWSEEEEMELTRVFQELRETESNDPERDLLDRVLDALICRERTRRQVAKKLKQMGLIADTREVSGVGAAARNRQPPRQWTEEETAQLTHLWNTLKDAMDPLTMIRDRLSLRRPKNRIRDKLLEMGLATDRKQLYKKRGPGRSGALGEANDGSDGVHRGTDSDSSDDSSAGGAGGGGAGLAPAHPPAASAASAKRRRRRSRPNTGGGRRAAAPAAASGAQIVDGLRRYMGHDAERWRVVLTWLQDSFSEAATLRRDEPDEALPLVALDDTCAEAIDTDATQTVLKLLGAQPPGTGEMFWRIGTHVSAASLEQVASLLAGALAGGLEEGAAAAADDSGKENADPAGPSPRPTIGLLSLETDGDSSDEGDADREHPSSTQRTPLSERSQGVQSARRSRLESGSQHDSDAIPLEDDATATPANQNSRAISDAENDVIPSAPTNRRSRLASSSDSDSDHVPLHATPASTNLRNRIRAMTSESSDDDITPSLTNERRASPNKSEHAGEEDAPDNDAQPASRSETQSSDVGLKRMLTSSSDENSDVEGHKKSDAGAQKKQRRVIDSDSD